MKIARYSNAEGVHWGVLDLERRALSRLRGGFTDWAPAITAGRPAGEHLAGQPDPLDEATLLAPLEPTAKIVCCGVNYRSHVEPLGATMPSQPVAFLKAPTAVIGHEDPIVHPSLTRKLDYEIELVCVIGAPRLADREHGSNSLLGYTIGNDVTARDLQRGELGIDLYSSKSLDDTCPIGPWITTRDEIAAPVDLELTLTVNDEVRQRDRTSGMHWNVDELLAFADSRTRLLCGDLVFTGTPGGVALEDGRFLNPGDRVEATIEGLGTLANTVDGKRKDQD